MNIEIIQNPDKSITLSGSFAEYEICNIYCNASKSDRNNLNMMKDLAESSKRMSDYLMWISELVRVNECIAYLKKVEKNQRFTLILF